MTNGKEKIKKQAKKVVLPTLETYYSNIVPPLLKLMGNFKHQSGNIGQLVARKTTIPCPICTFKHKSTLNVLKHFANEHYSRTLYYLKNCKEFQCKICSSKFPNLKEHLISQQHIQSILLDLHRNDKKCKESDELSLDLEPLISKSEAKILDNLLAEQIEIIVHFLCIYYQKKPQTSPGDDFLRHISLGTSYIRKNILAWIRLSSNTISNLPNTTLEPIKCSFEEELHLKSLLTSKIDNFKGIAHMPNE